MMGSRGNHRWALTRLLPSEKNTIATVEINLDTHVSTRWNSFKATIDESVMVTAAEKLVSLGLKDGKLPSILLID